MVADCRCRPAPAARNYTRIGTLVLLTMEFNMARINRVQLTRSVAGAFSALVFCTTAAFLVAHHLAK